MGEVSAAVFRDGKLIDRLSLDASLPPQLPSQFIWVQVNNPELSDFDVLQKRFGLHDLAVEDSMNATQVPKVDVYDDQIFVVSRVARLEMDEIKYAGIDAFVSGSHIITVQHGESEAYSMAREKFENLPRITWVRPDFILHAIIDFTVESYFPVIQMMEDDVLLMERQFMDGFLDRAGITRLFQLRREALHLQHVVTRMSDVCGKLTNLDVPCVGAEVRPYFRDVRDRLRRLDTLVAGLIDVVGAVFQASSLLEQQRQGVITRQLAAWAAILGVTTAIAGIYGMNFPTEMSGIYGSYGYPIALGLMFVIALAFYVRFKMLHWL